MPPPEEARPAAEPRLTRTAIRVRYVETDQLGNVNSAHYLTWFELGRSDYLRARGLAYAALEAKGLFLPVAEAEVRYLRRAGYDELLTLETRLGEVGAASVEFHFRVLRGEELLATGRTVNAACDRAGKVRRLPEELRRQLEA